MGIIQHHPDSASLPMPSNWREVELASLLCRPPSYGIGAAGVPLDHRLPAYLRITDITDEGRFSGESPVSVNHPQSANYLLEPGDVVFARTGASVGKSYLYRLEDGPLVYAGFLIRVSPNPDKLDPRYLAYFAQTRQYWEWVTTNSMRSGQPGINSQQLARLPVRLPPTLSEQRAIAGALSDADAWVASLERLIAKKRRIKLGVMQDLLTARRRLPGFEGKWEVQRLGMLGRCIRGVSFDPERDLFSSETATSVVLFRAQNVQAGDIVWEDVLHVTDRRVSVDQFLRDGDVVICMANGSRALVGKSARFRQPRGRRCTVGAFMGAFRPNGDAADPNLVPFLFESHAFRAHIDILLSGSSINNLTPGSIESCEVSLPMDRNEQQAIAAVLSDMDAEITALESKLTKARRIKQGMMQQLLTGRVRLVEPEPSAEPVAAGDAVQPRQS